MNSTVIEKEETSTLRQYTVTDEPMQDRSVKQLPRKAKDLLEELHDEIQYSPQAAIPKLLKLIKKHPDVPVFYNYLSVSYKYLNQEQEYEQAVLTLYEKFPDYLFAKVGYAELLLNKGEYHKIPEIFDNQYDLGRLHPKRRKFHVTEVIAFMGLMGLYAIKIENRDLAKRYSNLLKQVAPAHPTTQKLEQKLNPIKSFFGE